LTTVSVAIATYRRPVELPRLLAALIPQVVEAAARFGSHIEVVVADNDPDGSARATVENWTDGVAESSVLSLRVVHEPHPGIASVRNRLLDETVGSDVVVFIDDDETPAEGWLVTLLQAWHDGLADLIAGPVRPVYPEGVAPWIVQGPFHDGPHLETGVAMDHAACGNLLFDRRVVERLGARFPDYGTRGGEDSAFTKALTDKGATLRWCEEALVLEPVSPARTSARWVLTRSLGNGLSWGALLADSASGRGEADSPVRRAHITAQGAARVAAGAATVLRGIVRRAPQDVGMGGHRLARGAGMMAGAWGVVYDEYARPGTRRWRREIASR